MAAVVDRNSGAAGDWGPRYIRAYNTQETLLPVPWNFPSIAFYDLHGKIESITKFYGLTLHGRLFIYLFIKLKH